MTKTFSLHLCFQRFESSARYLMIVIALFAIVAFSIAVKAQQLDPQKTIYIEEVQHGEIFSYGKSVVIRKSAKGVLVFGGDVVIEGTVDGDVAAIGGSVYQREQAFIGGDVIIFGGRYHHASPEPLRNPGRETVMFAGYEEELKRTVDNPATLFSPDLSPGFFIQRVLATLFWFVCGLVVIALSPGAVSRASANFVLSPLKTVALGLVVFWVIVIGAIASVNFLPDFVNILILPMAFLALVIPLFFGRAVLQMMVGKWLQRKLFSDRTASETVALIIGTLFWTVLLSLPYVWVLVVLFLFSGSLGIVLGSRSKSWAERESLV